MPCEWVNSLVDIKGEVFDKNISGWVLEYTGGSSRGWTRIASGTGNIPAGDTIAIWDTTKLDRCAYTLRLRASDKARVGCVAPSGNAATDMPVYPIKPGRCESRWLKLPDKQLSIGSLSLLQRGAV